MSETVKDTIKRVALDMFSQKGYYGVSIRDIASASDCSLPMVYYYFKNKEGLFRELAYDEFMALNDRLRQAVTVHGDFEQMYLDSLLARLHVDGYDKQVYKLALKTSLGINQMETVQNLLREWEQSRYTFAREMLVKYYGVSDVAYANILSRVSSSIILRTIIFDEPIRDTDVEAEIRCVFSFIRQAGNDA